MGFDPYDYHSFPLECKGRGDDADDVDVTVLEDLEDAEEFPRFIFQEHGEPGALHVESHHVHEELQDVRLRDNSHQFISIQHGKRTDFVIVQELNRLFYDGVGCDGDKFSAGVMSPPTFHFPRR